MNFYWIFVVTLIGGPSIVKGDEDIAVAAYETEYSSSVLAEHQEILLDYKWHMWYLHWNVDTAPYPKYYMKFFDNSSDIQANKTFLNNTAFDQFSNFKDAVGIWVFPHTFKFNETMFAYFTRTGSTRNYYKLEFRCYLHQQAELRLFNGNQNVNVSNIFKADSTGKIGWQPLSVAYNTMKFHMEFHTQKYGDFMFLDKVTGFYRDALDPDPTTPKLEATDGQSFGTTDDRPTTKVTEGMDLKTTTTATGSSMATSTKVSTMATPSPVQETTSLSSIPLCPRMFGIFILFTFSNCRNFFLI